MIFLGYSLAVLMGLTLGLIGAGGSILTVPILVYCMHINPILASSHSLFIVGTAALVGAFFYWRKGLVDFKSVALFGIFALPTIFSTRLWIVPAIPDPVLHGISKDSAMMLLFAGLMLLAAFFMLHPIQGNQTGKTPSFTLKRGILLGVASIAVGILTALIGIGGGFLIIPTLVLLFGLPMKKAVGTSLTITTLNALVGFKGDLAHGISLHWDILFLFSSITLIGMGAGMIISQSVKGEDLKKYFGVFVLITSFGILARELFPLF